jgi:uncharacterized membrane protein
MNWYYAAGGQQQGPVDDTQLDALVSSGQVTAETLVWHEGLPNWQPLRQARPGAASAGLPPQMGAVPQIGGAAPATGEVVCAECGKIFTRDNAIQYGTAWVCAGCKPVFLQKLREGAATGSSPSGGPFDPDAFLTGLRQRDYSIDLGSCLGRAWDLVKANFWICVGVVALIYVCLFAAGVIPCVGGIIQLVVQGPLMGGMYWFFLKLVRRQEATVGDAFSGFSIGFLPLFLVALVSSVLAGLCMLPGAITLIVSAVMKIDVPLPIIVIAFAAGAVPAIYLTICWLFSMLLVVDKKLDFWPAMELSRKAVGMHWGSVFLLLLVCGLITMASVLALCVGVLVAAPVMVAAIVYAYEDIFSGGTAA